MVTRTYRWWMSQQKVKISFKIIMSWENDTQPLELNLETFYLILHMWELTRNIITMNILFSVSTCS